MALGTENISTNLVSTTLVGTTSLRDVGSLCTHPAINKWSKWKPIRQNTVSGITATILSNANFGLTPASTSTNYADVAGVKWAYNKPRGGDYNEPYRLGDFRNYNHSALPICAIDEAPRANRTFNTSKQITAAINVSGTADTIGLNDFVGTIGDMYFGAVIVDGSSVYIQTATATLSNGGNSFDLDLTTAPLNTDKTVDFNYLLSSVQVANLSLLSSVLQPTFAPLPTADTADNEVSLVITSGLGVTTTQLGIGIATNPMLNNISTYTTIPYVSFPTAGSFYMKLRLTNTTNEDVVIPSGTWQMTASPNYFGVNTNKHAAAIYDTSGNAISTITIAANSSVDVVVGTANLINMNGTTPATPTSGTSQESNIGIYFNNTLITGQTIKCTAP